MSEDHPDRSSTTNVGSGSRITRRRLLGAGAVGALGVGGLAGLGSYLEDDDCLGWPEGPEAYPEVVLTGSDPETTDFESIADAEEVVIYVHGWRGFETSTDQAAVLEEALRENDYEHPVVAASWPADSDLYWRTERRTPDAGRRLAEWLDSDSGLPEPVRVVGHSLGGRVALETLAALEDETLETVALLGTAADDDSVCIDGVYGPGIESNAVAVYNYHSENDHSVCTAYDLQSLSGGLGCEGSDCAGGWFGDSSSRPENYTDVDVTDEVAGHCSYQLPGEGCIPQVVSDFE